MRKFFFEPNEKNILRFFSNQLILILLVSFLTLSFFIPKLFFGKIPGPADSLIGLYHPFRDIQLAGFNPGKFPVKNPLITDSILQGYPWRFLTIKNLKAKNLPLWNPYSFSGQPLLANIQSAPFQLLNILFFLFPFKFAWGAQIIIPSVLSSIFMFLFLKNLTVGVEDKNLSTTASIFGSLILPFSGFFISWLTWGTIVGTVMWLPLILFCIDKLFSKKSFWFFVLLLLAITQTILAGHWQAAFYVFFATFLFILIKVLTTKKVKNALFPVATIFLGILITSFQILPSLEFIKNSARSFDVGYFTQREDWFLPLQNLIQLAAPDFFGNPTTYNYWGIWNYGEFVSFVGIIPLSLALFALIKLPKQAIFFCILAIISLVFALKNPVSQIPYILKFPLFSTMQPSRIIFLLDFSLVCLAVFGLDFFLKEKSKIKILFPAVSIGAMLLLLLLVSLTQSSLFPQIINLNPQQIAIRNLVIPLVTVSALFIISMFRILNFPKHIVIFLIYALTICELFRFGYKFTPFSKLSWYFPQTSTLEFLQEQPKPYRVISRDRRILHPNTSAVYSIESTDGYDPLYLASYASLVGTWQSNKATINPPPYNRIITPQKYDSKFTNLLNAKYILSLDEINDSNFEKVHEEGATKLYENKNVLPRAFFVDEVIKKESDQEELETLIAQDFDISKSATSQDFFYSQKSSAYSQKNSVNNQPQNSTASFIRYQDQALSISTTSDKVAPLVISNIYYPGWKAKVDGQKTQIYKVDYTLLAILVPIGNHIIDLEYWPDSISRGLVISAFGLLIAVIIGLYSWRPKFR